MAGLLVYDELLTLAQYCGRLCLYPYPVGPPLSIYLASEVSFMMVMGGVAIMILSLVGMVKDLP